MDFAWYTPELHAVVLRAHEMAVVDPDFAERARENPNAVLKNELNFDLPIKVKFVRFNETTFGLVPADESFDELSDELLDLISAGAEQPCNYNGGHV